jgi:hypothetical protein
MLSGPRLDPFSARLHAIHQKRRTLNPQPQPPPHEEHDAQGLEVDNDDVAQAVGVRADADEPALDLEPVKAVDTGCAECGGMGKKSDSVEELRNEVTAIKARLAELEMKMAALATNSDEPVYR